MISFQQFTPPDVQTWVMFFVVDGRTGLWLATVLLLGILLMRSFLRYQFTPRLSPLNAHPPTDNSFQGVATPHLAKEGLSMADESAAIAETKLIALEKVEMELAKKYGVTGYVDSVEVFQEARARAFTKKKDLISTVNLLYRPRMTNTGWSCSASSKTTPDALQRVDVHRFWAIVIGIDSYISSPLRGCVSDALLMTSYLTEVLGVPKDHIQSLVSSKNHTPREHRPTRANIIQALLGLATNSSVQKGDSIIIYFAGHGSSYRPLNHGVCEHSVTLKPDLDSIEALCPMDRGMNGMQGGIVPDISDREINAILAQISAVKGHRITVILDCCYSSSFTGREHEGVRAAPPLPHKSLENMLRAADEDLKCYPSHRSVLSQDLHPDMTSHVILAACKEYQYAKEVEAEANKGHNGVFTMSLVNTLKSGHLTDRSTYLDLLNILPCTKYQTPVLSGQRKDTCLWHQV